MLTTDPEYIQQSIAEYNQSPPRGPYTLAMGNEAVFLPLANVTSAHGSIAAAVLQQLRSKDYISYLPTGTSASVKTGYKSQIEALLRAYTHSAQPVLEFPTQGPPALGVLLKPLSRGSVLLNTSDPDRDAEPVITFGTFSNPIDLDIIASSVPFLRKVYATSPMRALGVVEVSPGSEVTSMAQIKDWARQSAVASFAHPCCTAAMMTKAHGGVVGRDLRVHGVQGLRVVDARLVAVLTLM